MEERNIDLRLIKNSDMFDEINNTVKESLKNYGLYCQITDFAILTGGKVETERIPNINNISFIENRTCSYFLDNKYKDKFITVMSNGTKNYRMDCNYNVIRPLLTLPFEELKKLTFKSNNNIIETEFGEYPQKSVSENYQQLLNDLLKRGMLPYSGEKYTFNFKGKDNVSCIEKIYSYDVYEYENEKFIRVKANILNDSIELLSNGNMYFNDEYVWIKILPIKWILEESTFNLISKDGLISGMNYDKSKEFIEKYMLNDILQSTNIKNTSKIRIKQKDE